MSNKEDIWLSVKNDIEIKIITGEYSDKIPTIVELIEQYNIGKSTAQKVINALCNNGIIVKKVGVGCFVEPDVREKLLLSHERELKETAQSTIEKACLLGLDKKKFMQLIDEKWIKNLSQGS